MRDTLSNDGQVPVLSASAPKNRGSERIRRSMLARRVGSLAFLLIGLYVGCGSDADDVQGKGGGKGAMAQGGGLNGPVQTILDSVPSLLPTS